MESAQEARKRAVAAARWGCQLLETCLGGTGLFENVLRLGLSWMASPPPALPAVPLAA